MLYVRHVTWCRVEVSAETHTFYYTLVYKVNYFKYGDQIILSSPINKGWT